MKTDDQLQKDVLEELKWEPSIHASEIGVEAKGGVVTLAGHVSSFAEKWNAEHAAQRVSGVKALAIEIDVRIAGSGSRTDGDIARLAKNILEASTLVPKDTVKIMVEGGRITLSGNVDWQYQREAAVDGVRNLFGVIGVSNQIGITPSMPSHTIKTDVEAALKRISAPSSRNVTVHVNDGVVTLTGSVNSWSDRDAASDSAWSASGVSNVVNEIDVTY